MDWIQRMNNAIKYIENNLLSGPNAKEASKIAFSSEYHFQRCFYMITGFTFNEYVRNRKLSLAAQDLLTKKDKIIDIALKYGYETPESFSRAFFNLHGVSPKESRKENIKLKAFPRITFTLSIKGETCMNFKIKTMESFFVTGKSIKVTNEGGKNLIDIPAFWKKCNEDGTVKKLEKIAGEHKKGILNGSLAAVLCYNETDTNYCWSYLAGAETFNEKNDMETIKVPAMTWAIFESIGPMPNAIQSVWKRIFSEWFPTSNYEHDKGPELEVYPRDNSSKNDYYCEVWIPVKKKRLNNH